MSLSMLETAWMETRRRASLPPYFSNILQQETNSSHTPQQPTTTHRMTHRRRNPRKCGFCRCVGHNILNCRHPMINEIIIHITADCRAIFHDKDKLTKYLSKRSLTELKIVASSYGMSMSFDKQTYVTCLTRIIHQEFMNIYKHPLHYIEIKFDSIECRNENIMMNDDMCCPICINEITEETHFVNTNCFHKFCGSCVCDMINSNGDKCQLKCPMCRTNVHSLTTYNLIHFNNLKTILKQF